MLKRVCREFPVCLKILRVMKLTLFLFFVSLIQVFSLEAYSQSARVSVNRKNATIKEILYEIESESDYYFLFNSQLIDVERKVDIDVSDEKIEQVLDKIFTGQDVGYTIMDRQIIIRPSASSDFRSSVQQVRTVSGKVTDSSGGPLPGVTVVIKNSTQGTITDGSGSYSLSHVPADATLVFSFVGMRSQEIPVAGKTAINVVMAEETIGIEEVVAIGYGTQKKVNLTGSVSSISSETLIQRPATNPTNLLQGRLSGLQVTQPTGQPGRDDPILQIRGLGSFGASSTPLIIVDGIPGSLSNLFPNDIENISVLKDAASASIYGSRAANGVILVTTKQAKSTSLEYHLDVGVHNATRLPELITNSAEYMEMYNSAMQRSGIPPIYTQEQIEVYKNATDQEQYPNFDWLDYYYNPAMVYNHNLSLSNVSDKNSYRFSLNYLNQKGILPNIKYKKYNASLNFSNQVHESIKIGTNLNAVLKDNHEPPNWGVTSPLAVYQHGPTYKPFLPDGSGRKVSMAIPGEGHNVTAPVYFTNGSREIKNYALTGQVYADVNLYKGLVWKTKAAIDYSDNFVKDHIYATKEHYFYHKLPGESDYTLDESVTAPAGAGLTDYYSKGITKSIYSILNYESLIGENHNIDVLIGFEEEYNKGQYLSGTRRVFPLTSIKELNAGSSDGQSLGGSANECSLRSFFGRIGYRFKEKYMIELNSRYDGTSRVSKEHRWGFFPSASAAWRVSEEQFVKENTPWMDNLKLRVSYGILGNQQIGIYPYQDILSLRSYPFGGSMSQGVLVTRLTDKRLRWESTKILDLGFDIDIKGDLFGLTFDWFKKNTFDILASQPVPGSIGISGPTTNDGELQNTGIEIELRHGQKLGKFTYHTYFIASATKNELLSIVSETKGINEVGLPYNSFYLWEMEGIFKDQNDIDNSPDHIYYNARPGDIKIKDQNDDGIIDADDRVSWSRYPDFTYSFGFDLNWNRFNLSGFFQGVEGQKVRIFGWGYDPFVQGDPPNTRFRDAWSPSNPDGKEPALYFGSGSPTGGYSGVYGYPSTYHLRDASYLRLKNLNLSYNFPKQFSNILKLQDLTIYFSGDNLFTFSNFPGLDPEQPGTETPGSAYPQVRILNLGFKIKL